LRFTVPFPSQPNLSHADSPFTPKNYIYITLGIISLYILYKSSLPLAFLIKISALNTTFYYFRIGKVERNRRQTGFVVVSLSVFYNLFIKESFSGVRRGIQASESLKNKRDRIVHEK